MNGILYTHSEFLRVQKEYNISFQMKWNNLPTYLRFILSYGSMKSLHLFWVLTQLSNISALKKYGLIQESN